MAEVGGWAGQPAGHQTALIAIKHALLSAHHLRLSADTLPLAPMYLGGLTETGVGMAGTGTLQPDSAARWLWAAGARAAAGLLHTTQTPRCEARM